MHGEFTENKNRLGLFVSVESQKIVKLPIPESSLNDM